MLKRSVSALAKLKKLKTIIAGTGAIIVLTSPWKVGWERFNKKNQNSRANYMDKKFDKYGMRIYDKTEETNWSLKEISIKKWLDKNIGKNEIVKWIILDADNNTPNYTATILGHLITTKKSRGLTDKEVDAAIKILNTREEITEI